MLYKYYNFQQIVKEKFAPGSCGTWDQPIKFDLLNIIGIQHEVPNG